MLAKLLLSPRSFDNAMRRTQMLRRNSSRFLLRRASTFVRCSSLNRLLTLQRIARSKLKHTGARAETVSLSWKQSFARRLSPVHMMPKVLLRERRISKTLGQDLVKKPINCELSPLVVLGKLLDSHNEMRANAERGLNGQSDKTTALKPAAIAERVGKAV